MSKEQIEIAAVSFDLAIDEHMEWVEGRKERKTWIPQINSPKGMMAGPEFETMEQVLALDFDPELPDRMNQSEIVERAEALMRDEEARRKFLYGE